jgi:hypothetical protein
MATSSITHAQRLDGVAVLTTLTGAEVVVGQSVTVAGVGNGFDGTFTVVAVPEFLLINVTTSGDFVYDSDVIIPNQILVLDAGNEYDRYPVDPYGTLTYTGQTGVTWITSADVQEFLGIASATANDTAYLATCVSAANAWCYRRRQAAGYNDLKASAPDGSIKLGTVLYAAGLYRERGSVDSYQTFDTMTTGAPIASIGRVLQLLGVNRSQVA